MAEVPAIRHMDCRDMDMLDWVGLAIAVEVGGSIANWVEELLGKTHCLLERGRDQFLPGLGFWT